MTALSEDEIMITGASNGVGRTTLIYNKNSNSFVDGPTLTRDRTAHTVAIFKSKLHGNRRVVFVAGGYHSVKTAELLDFTVENAQWTASKLVLRPPAVYTMLKSKKKKICLFQPQI